MFSILVLQILYFTFGGKFQCKLLGDSTPQMKAWIGIKWRKVIDLTMT